jgi:hypothetical protein
VDGSCHDQFEGVFLACIQRDWGKHSKPQ